MNSTFSESICHRCQHVRKTENKRGSVFFLCGLSAVDDRFPKYPPQPVRLCAGFKQAES